MIRKRWARLGGGMAGLALLCLLAALRAETGAPVTGPRADYRGVATEISRRIAYEMEDKELPAVSIALVDDRETVWAEGFGWSDPEAQIPATADTVYRVGSVSKLFTDIAILQLVELNQVALDVPVTHYLPDFRPRNPFGRFITLRQLMSHRSGLVREPPIGNYFDAAQPSLSETIASLNATELVFAPEERMKYSNAGIAVVGYVLERIKGKPFVEALQEAVLGPAGMTSSAFALSGAIEPRLAKAFMWTYDGRRFEAPRFELGMAPAGSLYSTVTDLGLFMSALFGGGKGTNGHLLNPETLAAMYEPQFAPPGAEEGYGIGFNVSRLGSDRIIRHGGAIYGFATELALLPEKKLGAVAVTTLDAANTVVERIVHQALASMDAARAGSPFPEWKRHRAIDRERARRLVGRYVAADGERIELIDLLGHLWLERQDTRVELKAAEEGLIADGRLGYGTRLRAGDPGRIELDGKPFRLTEWAKPEPPPERFRGLVGEYGWDYNTLYVFEKDGRLQVLMEWFELDPLRELSPDVFAFPDRGLYPGERLIFKRDAQGEAVEVEAASVVFPRRALAGESGGTFRIEPLLPVAELRALADQASPPPEEGDFSAPDLIDLTTLDPTLRFDIRYATANNFMGLRFYSAPRAFLQRPAAEALLRAHQSLRDRGLGLLIHDAYRPWFVTKMFWEATPAPLRHFVADPSRGSRHNRGAAVDLTLCDLVSGGAVPMVSGYDEFTSRAHPGYIGGTSLERWHRELLRAAMEAQRFDVYEFEWWHFDFRDWQRYPILNVPFEEAPSAVP